MNDAEGHLMTVFSAALDCGSADERQEYLDRACAGDPALRHRVEALLRAHERAGGFLGAPGPESTVGREPSAESGPAAAPEAGTIVAGRYKLLERIGEGGMGEVWMAEQAPPVRRTVALKLIRPGMDSRGVLARFEAERQALALMDHPNIARVLDAGATDSGRPYFVMELVKGQPFTTYCDDVRLDLRGRLELFGDVCRAVQHAHQKGIIHRDIKPSNVLVAPYDGRPVVKVIDFGVAKAIGQRLTEETLFTGFGAVVGTPRYMSPEQAEVNNQDIDTRSDIYALGVLLYELLTGTTPLTRHQAMEVALLEVLRVIREEEPPRPSTRLSESRESLPSISAHRQTEPAKLTKLVRGELDWIAMKCLEKDRSRRYETASGLARDVQRYLADEPVQAGPPGVGYRVRKFVRRNRGPVVAAGLFLALLVVGVVGTSVGLLRAVKAERDAEANFRHARQAVDDMYTQVARKWLAHQPQMEPVQREFLEKALAFYRRSAARSGADPALRLETARAHARVGEIEAKLGGTAAAESAYGEAIAIFQRLADDFPDAAEYQRELADSLQSLGVFLGDTGRNREEEQTQRRAEVILRRLVARFPADPLYRHDLARVLDNLGRFRGDAQDTLGEAIALQRKLVAEVPTEPEYRAELAHSLIQTGAVNTGSPGERQKHEREAVALLEKLDADFPGNPAYRNSLGEGHYYLAMALPPEEAVKEFHRAIAIQERLLKDHPSVNNFRHDLARSLQLLGDNLFRTGKRDEAVEALRRAIAVEEPLASVPKVNYFRSRLAAIHRALGDVFANAGRFAEAEQEYRKAISFDEGLLAEFRDMSGVRPRLAIERLALGLVQMEGGQTGPPEEKQRRERQAMALLEKLLAEFPPENEHRHDLARSVHEAGHLLERMGQRDAAEKAYRQALVVEEALVAAPKDHDHVDGLAELHRHLGEVLAAPDKGRLDEAIAEYRAAIRLGKDNARAHVGLGNALRAQGRRDEAIAAFREAIRLKEDLPEAHVNLGNALADQGRRDEAIAEYRAAIATKQNFPEADKAHVNLGNVLAVKGQAEEAIAEYREAIRLKKDSPEAHYSLGLALGNQGRRDEAIAEYREAIRLKPDYPEAHCNLGDALRQQGEFREALEELRRGHEMGSRSPRWRYPSARWVRRCERLVELDAELPRVLKGEAQPADAAERLELARMCQLPGKSLNAAAVRFYADVFAADPKVADDLSAAHRYNAACAAALAGYGQGKDADKLDGRERGRLRRRALDWLRADLDDWRRLLDKEPDKVRSVLVQQLRHWLEDPDFTGVRGPQALAQLPEAERRPWQNLWDDVANTLARAQGPATLKREPATR